MLLVASAGCTSKKQEATEELKEAIKKCRAASGPVYEAPIMKGSDKKQVLTSACNKEMSKVKMVDEFTAQTETGPYTWEAGRDQSIGVWTVKSVSWKALDQARSHLEGDPSENELKRAIEKLRQAQKEFPESSWVRLKLLDALLLRRTNNRKSDASGLKLKEPVQSHLEETVQWATKNEKFETAMRARLKIVDYYEGFISQMRDARSALGSRDGWYENAIEVAEEEGNEKKAKQYKKELKKLKEERPKKKKRYSRLIEQGETELCGTVAQLKLDGIEDDDLKKRVKSAKSGTDCRKLLKGKNGSTGNPSDGDGGSEQ